MIKRFTLSAITCFTVLSMPHIAHAGLFEDEEARKAILDLRKEVRESAASNASQQQQFDDKLNALAEQLNKRFENALELKIDLIKKGQLELSTALSQSKDEQARLRGQLEVLGNELTLANRRIKELESNTDTRLKKLEPRKISIDGQESVVDRAEDLAFNSALGQFKSADYKASIAAFQTFIAQYPKSELIASAYFWLGNSQYANRDAKSAAASLQTMLQKAPEHPRAADAHLTLAHSYNELGDKKNAQTVVNQLITNYPNTPAAEAAKDLLPKPPAPKPKKK